MKPNAGYTLVEILVAMAILIFGVVAIMRMLPIALREAHLAGEQTVAAAQADSHLGVLRQRGAEDVLLLDRPDIDRVFTYDPNSTLPVMQRHAAANVLYTGWRYAVQRMEGANQVYLQRVTYTVELPNGRRESFVTYISRQ